jgi:tetratricopeptide (TPR) repeat protein
MAHSADTYALQVRKGSIEMQQANYSSARQSFQSSIQAHPEISLGYFALAQCAMKEDHDQEAVDVLTLAEAKAAPDAKVDYLKGIALSHLGRRDEAVAALQKSIQLDGSVAESHYELGRQLLDAGQIQPAKKEFERVIAIAPQHANAFSELSKIYSKLGDKESAARMARETQTLLADRRSRAMQTQKANITGFQEVHQK